MAPGPRLTAGTPCAASRATSVQACFGSAAVPVRVSSRCTSGWSQKAGQAGERSVSVTSAPWRFPSATSSQAACSSDLSGAKRKLRLRVQRSGTTLRACPPSMRVQVSTSR